MARPLRIDVPYHFYHVLNRGVEQRRIFDDSHDYRKFIELLGLMSERYEIEIWSFVLMGNHFHLLLRPKEANLSKAMQWLGLSYGGYYNQRNRRTGPLFQGRFKSFLVEKGHYLRGLTMYIHRNPLRARMVDRLADYPWSSYPCLAYGRGCVPWLRKADVLKMFDNQESELRKATQAYSKEEAQLLENLVHGLLLGGERFVEKMRSLVGPDSSKEQPQMRQLQQSKPIRQTVRDIAKVIDIDSEELKELLRPVRRRIRPMRDLLIYLVWRNSHHRVSLVASTFGLKHSSLSAARTRGKEYLNRNRKLRSALKKELRI